MRFWRMEMDPVTLHHELSKHFSEDVVQETIARLLERPEPPGNVLHWARKTAKHLTYREAARGGHPRRVAVNTPVDSFDPVVRHRYATVQQPEQHRRLEAREQIERAHPALVLEALTGEPQAWSKFSRRRARVRLHRFTHPERKAA